MTYIGFLLNIQQGQSVRSMADSYGDGLPEQGLVYESKSVFVRSVEIWYTWPARGLHGITNLSFHLREYRDFIACQ